MHHRKTYMYIMILASRDFLANQNINETNSLLDLVQNISPDTNEEVNCIDHSIYYSDQDYKECIARSKGALRILNLNCGGLNAKFDRLKFFLTECNNDLFPLHVITLQETHIKARCTPEKLIILTKHSKTLFFNHVVKNIVNYQLQKLYIKRTSIKGLNYAFAT